MKLEFENKGEFNKDIIEQEFWKKNFGADYGQLSKEQVDKITQRLPKKSSILEIGSDQGLLLKQLKDSGKEYDLTGSDFTEKSRESCEKIAPFISLDIKKDEIDKKYDVIIMKNVLGILELAKELDLMNKGLSLSSNKKIFSS